MQTGRRAIRWVVGVSLLAGFAAWAQTATTTTEPLLNRSTTTFSNGTRATTTHQPLLNRSTTTFSDGTRATTTTQPLLNRSTTVITPVE